MSLHKRLKEERELQGMNRKDIASRIGVSYGMVYQWEHGKSLSIERLCEFCVILGLSPTDVLRSELAEAERRLEK